MRKIQIDKEGYFVCKPNQIKFTFLWRNKKTRDGQFLHSSPYFLKFHEEHHFQ